MLLTVGCHGLFVTPCDLEKCVLHVAVFLRVTLHRFINVDLQVVQKCLACKTWRHCHSFLICVISDKEYNAARQRADQPWHQRVSLVSVCVCLLHGRTHSQKIFNFVFRSWCSQGGLYDQCLTEYVWLSSSIWKLRILVYFKNIYQNGCYDVPALTLTPSSVVLPVAFQIRDGFWHKEKINIFSVLLVVQVPTIIQRHASSNTCTSICQPPHIDS